MKNLFKTLIKMFVKFVDQDFLLLHCKYQNQNQDLKMKFSNINYLFLVIPYLYNFQNVFYFDFFKEFTALMSL